MKLPGLVKTRTEAKAMIAELFALPDPLPRTSTELIRVQMKQTEAMRQLVEWLMDQPKIYKTARFDISHGAADTFERNLFKIKLEFGSAWAREKMPAVEACRNKDTIKVPLDHPVQPLRAGDHPPGEATCGTCGLSWDDDLATSMTPAPSGRCPFEAFHPDDDDKI